MAQRLYNILFMVLVLIVSDTMTLKAQEQNANRALYFIYIDHESTTSINKLCNRLKDLRDDAIETGDGLIVYLANDLQPLVSFTNLPDPEEKYLGDDRFDDIIGALQETHSHDVNPTRDVATICKIMETVGLNDEDLKLGYKSVTMDFHIGPQFWALNNNELMLARLYFILDIPTLKKEDLVFNIYKPRETTLAFENGMPFGIKNLDNINSNTRILEY